MWMVHAALPSKSTSGSISRLCAKPSDSNSIRLDSPACRAAREMGVERLIHLSAMNASPNPEPKILPTGSRFLKSKYYGELAVMEEFPNATIIRPADMYGEADNFLWYYQHLWRRIGNTVPLWKKGEHTIKAPVYAGDVAKAIVNAAFDPTTAGQIYQGVGPEQFVLADLVDYMYQLMRKQGVWGYKRTDLRYDPITQLKALVTEKFTNGNSAVFAGLSRERLEREHVDDIIDNSLPTLEDLDVKLATIDDKVGAIKRACPCPFTLQTLISCFRLRFHPVPILRERIHGFPILPARAGRVPRSEKAKTSRNRTKYQSSRVHRLSFIVTCVFI